MMTIYKDEVQALGGQLQELVGVVEQLSAADFARPTRCPGWSVAELVAHCEGILHRLVGVNSRPVAGEAEIDRVGYYRYDPDGRRKGEDPDKTFSEVIRDRVIEEVDGRSGEQLATSLKDAVRLALVGIAEIPGDRVVQRSGHPRITFSEFVVSRNVEFGIHTMDIAEAVGRPQEMWPAAAGIVTGILDELLGQPVPAALGWDAVTYVLTGSGRRPLDQAERAQLGELALAFPLLR